MRRKRSVHRRTWAWIRLKFTFEHNSTDHDCTKLNFQMLAESAGHSNCQSIKAACSIAYKSLTKNRHKGNLGI